MPVTHCGGWILSLRSAIFVAAAASGFNNNNHLSMYAIIT